MAEQQTLNLRVDGSIPSRLTTYLLLPVQLTHSEYRRLHYFSTNSPGCGLLEEIDRTPCRRGSEVHVALRRADVLMSGQFLDRAGRSPTHRQMRAERVSQDVRPVDPQVRPPRRARDELLQGRFLSGCS